MLAEYVKQGYCFTHTFHTGGKDTFGVKQKNSTNFDKTQVVFIDVDDSAIPAKTFYSTVSMQPSMLYTTPNNREEQQQNRYRLVYLFDTPITDKGTYKELATGIVKKISEEVEGFKVDKSCLNCTQQMGGNSLSNCQLYKNHSVFSFSDFIAGKTKDYRISKTYKKEKRNSIEIGNAEQEMQIRDEECVKEFWEIRDEQSAYAFLTKYKDRYPLYEETPVDEKKPFIDLSEGYVKLERRCYMTKDERGKWQSRPAKIHKGSRERVLFINAAMRMKMMPDMSFEHLLYAMVFERQYWIDNADGTITNKVLYETAKNARMKWEQYKPMQVKGTWKSRNKSGYKVNPAYCKANDVSKRSMANKIRKMKSDKVLMENYDFSMSVAKNSKILKHKGIKPNSEGRLLQFVKEWKPMNNL